MAKVVDVDARYRCDVSGLIEKGITREYVHIKPNELDMMVDEDGLMKQLPLNFFLECSSLKEIILPQSVRKIGNQGLRTNYPMESLVFEGEEAPELGNGSFPFTEDLVRITIPTGCMETYRNKWSDHPGYLKKIEERP